jgi:hypothetical protein
VPLPASPSPESRLKTCRSNRGGKTITETLSRKPESDEVIVDYGFARGETKAAQQE